MWGMVFIWLAATRPEASCPLPSPPVALNHGRWAGAFAWVRTQTWCLAASTLMASIISRALLESGTCFFCVAAATAVMTWSPYDFAVTYRGGVPFALKPKLRNDSAAPDPGSTQTRGIAPLPETLQSTQRHAGAAGPSFGAQEILDGAGESLGLVEVGNVPGAGKLRVTRAGQRFVELAHGRRGGVLLADHEQDRPRHRCHRRGIVVVGKRGGASDEAVDRRGADHLAHLVEVRRIGLDGLRRKPARESRLDQRLHALLLRDHDALFPLLAAGRRRLARRVADDSAVAPPMDRPPKCAFLIASASISASASAISSSNA